MINLKKIESASEAQQTDTLSVYYAEESERVIIKSAPKPDMIITYNVTSTTSPTLLYQTYGSEAYLTKMSIDGGVFGKTANTYTFDTLGEHTVGFQVDTSVTTNAPLFYQITAITKVDIIRNITTFWYLGFYQATNLAEINFGPCFKKLPSSSFVGCNKLETLVLPQTIETVDTSAFASCYGVKNLTVEAPIDIVPGLFNGGSNFGTYLETLKIGPKVKSLKSNAFQACNNLKKVTINEGITEIPEYCFNQCVSLERIDMPDSVTTVKYSAFYSCSSLTSFTMSDNVTIISASAFYGCSKLAHVSWSNNLNYIGASAFNGCALTNVVIPSSVRTIGDTAFQMCSSLTAVTIPNTITSIGKHVFYTDGLLEISIPNNWTEIPVGTCMSCSDLTTINIPHSVTTIKNAAFHGCTSVVTINYDGTIAEWQAMTKESSWHTGIPSTNLVTCTDGTTPVEIIP